MDLQTLANIAEILGATSVIGAIFFAALQVRDYRRQRLEFAALELVRSWQNPEFVRAFRMLQTLHDRVPAPELREIAPDAEDQAFVVGMMFEGVGLMVHRSILPIEVVEELRGAASRVVFRKLEAWIEEWRRLRNPRAYEWVEWLIREMPEDSSAAAASR